MKQEVQPLAHMNREVLSDSGYKKVVSKFFARLEEKRKDKGDHVLCSSHEALGIVLEECHELLDACRAGQLDKFEDELFDVMIACVVSLASARDFD
jgi:NTP pyrophosphatase (non-canonical NTP hydrolase)